MRLGYYTIIFSKYFKFRERVNINHTYKLFIYLFIYLHVMGFKAEAQFKNVHFNIQY